MTSAPPEGQQELVKEMRVTAQIWEGYVGDMLTKAANMLEAGSQQEGKGETVRKALRRAYGLGQLYWQQADSHFTSHHKRSDETQAKFEQLVVETVAAVGKTGERNDN